MQIVSS